LIRLHETESQLTKDWATSMGEIEGKVQAMKKSVTVSVDQLRENLKLLNQYKVKLQTMTIRVKIEQKVKAMYESAQFE
jgi:predicted DNA-binding protein YlxM (UPF0122 family)